MAYPFPSEAIIGEVMGPNHSVQIHHFYGHYRRNNKAGPPSTGLLFLNSADDRQLRHSIRLMN